MNLDDLCRNTGRGMSAPERAALRLRQRREAAARAAELWKPQPGPQEDAFHGLADETFYGGQAGGGKSDLLLGLALTFHRSSIIFRREFSQFRGPEGLVERSRQIIGTDGRLNETQYTWRDLPGGRSLEFGAVQQAEDMNKYKGRAHDLTAFDEVTEFLESQYRFLIAWNRTRVKGQRCRVVATGNPPTSPAGNWVIAYWAPWLDPHHPNPAGPGELRWFAVIDGEDVEVSDGSEIEHNGEQIRPTSRTFIKARVEDNPYLMGTDYKKRLQNLPEPLRSQLLLGDFTASQVDDQWQVLPTDWVRQAQDRWGDRGPEVGLTQLGVDPSRGGVDKTVIAKRYGNWIAPLEKIEGHAVPDGLRVVQHIFRILGNDNAPVAIDVIGIGTSVYDHAGSLDLDAHGLNGAERSSEMDKTKKLGFANKRAQWHWRLREALDPSSGQDIALPPDTALLGDLCAPRWKLTVRGIQIESKNDIKKRLGRSPDCGEAVIYAFAELEPPLKWRIL